MSISFFHTNDTFSSSSPIPRVAPLRSLAVLTCLIATPFICGCGKAEKVIPQLPVFPVSGKITIDGTVPAGAQIALSPSGESAPVGVTAQATVQKDGTFQVGTYSKGDGAPAGDYIVTVQWFKLDSGGVAGPDVVPRKYSDPKTSPLKVTVASAPTTLDPITITK